MTDCLSHECMFHSSLLQHGESRDHPTSHLLTSLLGNQTKTDTREQSGTILCHLTKGRKMIRISIISTSFLGFLFDGKRRDHGIEVGIIFCWSACELIRRKAMSSNEFFPIFCPCLKVDRSIKYLGRFIINCFSTIFRKRPCEDD